MRRMTQLSKSLTAVGLFLFFHASINTMLIAQSREVPISRPKHVSPRDAKNQLINKIGLTLGLGISVMEMSKLNQRLAELQIGRIDNYQASRTISLYAGNDELAVSADVNLGTAFENTLVNPDSTALNFDSFSLGMNLYRSVLNIKRAHLLLSLGFRYTDLQLEYNSNTRSSANFNALLGNSSGSSSVMRLESNSNVGVPVGVRFQYKLGRQPNERAMEYKVGFDTGYVINVINSDWRETGSAGIVKDMPEVKPGNIYFNLNFSAFLKR